MRETVEIMRYPVTLTPAPEGGYMVSFVDIPEALTQGETVAEAMEAAKDALLTAFDFYFEDNELIPLPSPLNSHDHFIEVPLSVASKVLLLNAFLQSEITQQELARRIGKPKQQLCLTSLVVFLNNNMSQVISSLWCCIWCLILFSNSSKFLDLSKVIPVNLKIMFTF